MQTGLNGSVKEGDCDPRNEPQFHKINANFGLLQRLSAE